jgi:hypothetical protein
VAILNPVQQLKTLYGSDEMKPLFVDVPEMQFLMIDGDGDPHSSETFHHALDELYSTAYTLKFALRDAGIGPEYDVAPAEALFWSTAGASLRPGERSELQWTLLLAQPDFVRATHVADAAKVLRDKRGEDAADGPRLARFHEGRVAQIMHVGPHKDQSISIAKLLDFIRASGCRPTGKHHHIYLSDPRRCGSEPMHVVFRQPVA